MFAGGANFAFHVSHLPSLAHGIPSIAGMVQRRHELRCRRHPRINRGSTVAAHVAFCKP